tara:strand:+ start:1325 stop:1495 length:171 start_codon:yes stop_codon:yes gene_type:complete
VNKKLWEKIQKWKDYYNSTPNGWAIAYRIGEEYITDISKMSPSKRKKFYGQHHKEA